MGARAKCDKKNRIQVALESSFEPRRSEGVLLNYRHLNSDERSIINLGHWLEKSTREIAFVVGRHHSTIARELRKGRDHGLYFPMIARADYEKRRKLGGPRRKIRGNLKRWIIARLRKQWSPEQIVGRLKLERKNAVSIETVYRFVYAEKNLGGELWKNLRRSRPKRKRRFPRHTWRKPRPSLDERPLAANNRSQIGHLERDLVEGTRETGGALLTIVDRKSRFVHIEKVRGKWAKEIHLATLKALHKSNVRSITNDNGLEFSSFEKTAHELKTKVYFTRPYASWERGSIENMNGLIRQYFPKKASLNEIQETDLRRVRRLLNERPRKTLGYLSPAEVQKKFT